MVLFSFFFLSPKKAGFFKNRFKKGREYLEEKKSMLLEVFKNKRARNYKQNGLANLHWVNCLPLLLVPTSPGTATIFA